jgi:hypothetical protein
MRSDKPMLLLEAERQRRDVEWDFWETGDGDIQQADQGWDDIDIDENGNIIPAAAPSSSSPTGAGAGMGMGMSGPSSPRSQQDHDGGGEKKSMKELLFGEQKPVDYKNAAVITMANRTRPNFT